MIKNSLLRNLTRQIPCVAFLALFLSSASVCHAAERTNSRPRLVVNIVVDQLRSDFLEAFSPHYGNSGFKRLLSQGEVYSSVSYPFTPVDRASAVAALTTGTAPYYNSIVGQRWLNRETLRPVRCTDDEQYPGVETAQTASPARLGTSTLADELKVASGGKAIVWSVAPYCDAAVMAGGHAADGVLWFDDQRNGWCSSEYYCKILPQWARSKVKANADMNAEVTDMALACVAYAGMGKDEVTDLLCIMYSAGGDAAKLKAVYMGLDIELIRLVTAIEQRVGQQNVLFVLTSTGYCEEREDANYETYRIPTGTFYMSRTADLLNMYMGAIWGQGKYVEATFRNHIFLNHNLLDKKTISISEATSRAQELLVMMSGVRNVYTSLQLLTLSNEQIERVRNGYNPEHCGDLVVEAAPGWRVLTENTGESEYSRASFFHFPIIFYGAGMEAQRIQTPVTIDRIAPTIARVIRTRTPNACSAEPLF